LDNEVPGHTGVRPACIALAAPNPQNTPIAFNASQSPVGVG